jgi:uncharacterized protein (DUF362 family)
VIYNERPQVILRFCDKYAVPTIRRIVREGLQQLNIHPFGRTLLKPNLVSSGALFDHAYTRPEFTEGVLLALRDENAGSMTELAVGERSGITIPTRYAFAGAGYFKMLKRLKVKRYFFDEEQQVEYALNHTGRLRDYIFVPQVLTDTDFFVNCPKFKAHPWTTVTFSMKNYIGLQDDRHRLIDHDTHLNQKVADLQYIIQPKFIAIDAIIAGEGRMLTPLPYAMKLIIMGNNQVAFDAVCCQIIGIPPLSVEHIRLAHERGFGPVELSQIDITGDVSLDQARQQARSFRSGLIRVEDYFRKTRIKTYAGVPHKNEACDYCWGGCPGALEEAIEILRLFDNQTDNKMPPLHLVFGAYEGPINAKPGEKVIFMGNCAAWQGTIGGEPVVIRQLPATRSKQDPHYASPSDIYQKMASITLRLLRSRRKNYLRVPGCPVSVAEQVLLLADISGAKNPYFDPRTAINFTKSYLDFRVANLFKFRPYQKPKSDGRNASH